jgi:hypothetical protein
MTPRPRSQAVAQRHTVGGLHGLLATAVLVLGLGAVAATVASKPGLSASNLSDRSGTAWSLNPVGSRPEVFHYLPISPFDHAVVHRPWLLTIVLTVLYLGSTAAIGSIIVKEVRGEDNWPRPVSAVAGFLPGYLMLLAPLQVLFAAAPVHTAAWIALAALPLSAVALHWHTFWRSAVTVLHDPRALHKPTVTVCGIVAMTALALVHRLQAGIFFLTQDSIQWFLAGAEGQLQGRWGPYLAQWNLQSDEWLFNAPLMFSSHNIGDLWFPFYATQCVSLVSLLALVFGVVHRLARKRKSLAGGLTVAVFFGSTLAIYPWIYLTIVIGGQPLVQLGHPGRHAGIIAPWIALLLLGRQPRRAVTIALAFVTLGLGFVSLHVLVDVLAALVAGLIYRAVQGSRPGSMDLRGVRTALYLLPLAALTAMAAAFWAHAAQPPAGAVWLLVLAVIIAAGGAFAIGPGTARRAVPVSFKAALAWTGGWLAAVAGGLVLSDNLTGGRYTRTALGAVLPGYGGPLLERGGLSGNGDNVLSGLR